MKTSTEDSMGLKLKYIIWFGMGIDLVENVEVYYTQLVRH